VRYYDLKITKQDGTLYQFKSCGAAFGGQTTLTSLLPTGPQNPVSGLTNPAALQIEFDIPLAHFTDPDGQSAWLRVWGLGLSDLGHASDLNNLNVQIFGGMAKGLPLANPAQAGLLMQGTILQCFGNWIGMDQTLDMLFAVGGAAASGSTTGNFIGTGADIPGNFAFNMPAGMPLATAIANTLMTALPDIPPSIAISPNLVLNYDQVGHYTSLYAFASFVRALSQGIIGGTDYDGVQIVSDGTSIKIFDSLGPTPIAGVTAIAFQDLIGQPTWIAPNTISFKTVLRADIHQGDTVSLPQALVTQTGAANSNFAATPQTSLTFSGQFIVTNCHHYGHSRQPSADAWNTTYQATIV
jgi:hypothetical protein